MCRHHLTNVRIQRKLTCDRQRGLRVLTQGGSHAANFAVMHNGSPNNVLG
jgi:hypothetical protein